RDHFRGLGFPPAHRRPYARAQLADVSRFRQPLHARAIAKGAISGGAKAKGPALLQPLRHHNAMAFHSRPQRLRRLKLLASGYLVSEAPVDRQKLRPHAEDSDVHGLAARLPESILRFTHNASRQARALMRRVDGELAQVAA